MTGSHQPDDFETNLQEALRRIEPPSGFTDRVMARIPDSRPAPRWRRQWLAVAAATCIAVVGAGEWKQHQRQLDGERAKQDLIYALTVASESLRTTKHILTR